MNCLINALFFLVFSGLLTTDAQARILPEISILNNDLIIANAGRTSGLLPPSSTSSVPQSIEEISSATSLEKNYEKTLYRNSPTPALDPSRSSILQIIIDIEWVMSSPVPDPKASSSPTKKLDITTPDEIATPCNGLVPSSSSILFLPPASATPEIPKAHKRAPPSPRSSSKAFQIGISSSRLTGSPCSSLKSVEINDYEQTPSSSVNASPIPATPGKQIYETPLHPPATQRPSSTIDQLEMIGSTTNPSDGVISMITDRKKDGHEVS